MAATIFRRPDFCHFEDMLILYNVYGEDAFYEDIETLEEALQIAHQLNQDFDITLELWVPINDELDRERFLVETILSERK